MWKTGSKHSEFDPQLNDKHLSVPTDFNGI